MDVFINKIKLKPGFSHQRYETWVRERDYATSPQFEGLARFFVSRARTDPEAPFHYFEVIVMDSKEALEAAMQTEAFKGLLADFGEMGEIVESFAGAQLDPGFFRD